MFKQDITNVKHNSKDLSIKLTSDLSQIICIITTQITCDEVGITTLMITENR